MNHSDLVQKYFMKDAVTVDEHRITALHTALVNGGVFVYVLKCSCRTSSTIRCVARRRKCKLL